MMSHSRPTAADYLRAARVPETLKACENPEQSKIFPWHVIRRLNPNTDPFGFKTQTLLCRWDWGSINRNFGTIVMDDSYQELKNHLPIWMAAKGRVLKTGLGLGCVVRGLLINPDVEHVDVIEIDDKIVKLVGPEFYGNPRVTIHHGDAHEFDTTGLEWDYIWHDIHDNEEKENLTLQHARLMIKYAARVPKGHQGAWAFPRFAKRQIGRILG